MLVEFHAGIHGTTFGGSPLACAIGYHVLSRLSDPVMAAKISGVSSYLIQRLQHLYCLELKVGTQ